MGDSTVTVEMAYRVTVGEQVIVVNDDEADAIIEGINYLRKEEPTDAVADLKLVVHDDDESNMSLRKLKRKEKAS